MKKINDISEVFNINKLKGKNVLFLQGPLGNFFKNTIMDLESNGVGRCYQLVLNQGDRFYSKKKNRIEYRGKIKSFDNWISDVYEEKSIDYIFLLGDSRMYHKKAIKRAKEKNIKIYVFEEGYFRPNFITLEKGGVNNNSSLPREKDFYLDLDLEKIKEENIGKQVEIASPKRGMCISAMIYYILMYVYSKRFKNYKHHRTRSPWFEFYYGIKSYMKRYINMITERDLVSILKEKNKRFFLVILQVREDFQVREHSDFRSIEHYIEDVLVSFKENNKNKDEILVIKHHPMDRGKVDYRSFIDEVCFHIKLNPEKVIYFYDINLPKILKYTKGCVTINSTVGLQALYHNIPTKVIGRAVYDFEGLTDQKGLDDFWDSPKGPNKELYDRYREYLINKTQVTGSFYIK